MKSVMGSVTTYYVGNYFEWTGSTSTMVKYYYAGGQRVALRTGSAAPLFLLGDHLGSTSKTYHTANGATTEQRYTPWGETRYGSSPTSYQYTGQRKDATGLHFYNARYYDPALGRFLAADSIVPSPENPQSLNRYSYTLNNPLRYTDPTGHAHYNPGDGSDSTRHPKVCYGYSYPQSKGQQVQGPSLYYGNPQPLPNGLPDSLKETLAPQQTPYQPSLGEMFAPKPHVLPLNCQEVVVPQPHLEKMNWQDGLGLTADVLGIAGDLSLFVPAVGQVGWYVSEVVEGVDSAVGGVELILDIFYYKKGIGINTLYDTSGVVIGFLRLSPGQGIMYDMSNYSAW